MFANFLDCFETLRLLAVGETCREWCNVMNEQLDLEKEANHLVEFSQKFANDSWAAFPTPIEGFVNRNVLVETLMEGTSIMNYMKLKANNGGEGFKLSDAANELKLRLSDLGCRAVIKMVFFDNLIHGDMHPGNILVQFDEKTGAPRLVFLDAGKQSSLICCHILSIHLLFLLICDVFSCPPYHTSFHSPSLNVIVGIVYKSKDDYPC